MVIQDNECRKITIRKKTCNDGWDSGCSPSFQEHHCNVLGGCFAISDILHTVTTWGRCKYRHMKCDKSQQAQTQTCAIIIVRILVDKVLSSAP